MADSMTVTGNRLLATEADALAAKLTNDRMRVVWNGDGRYFLTHVGKRQEVHLLPYQLTAEGIRQAVAENDPWPPD